MQRREGWLKFECQPGRKYKCCEQRENHCNTTQNGNGRHVRPHHTSHGRHRKQCCDDRISGEDRWITHLVNGLNCRLRIDATFLQPSPVHIFHHHDGIINKNTDGENQCKQAHSINRKTHHERHKHRKGDDDRDNNGDHNGSPPAEKEPHQQDNRTRRHEQLEDQFIHLLISRLAIITRNTDMNIIGDNSPLEIFYKVQRLFSHRDTITTLLLCNR